MDEASCVNFASAVSKNNLHESARWITETFTEGFPEMMFELLEGFDLDRNVI